MERKQVKGHPVLASVLLILLLLFLIVLVSKQWNRWHYRGRTEGAVIELPATELHTQTDMDRAADVILEWFEDMEGCTLNRLWYEEAWAAPMEEERAGYEGVSREDCLVILMDYQTGDRPLGYPYDMNTRYPDSFVALCWEREHWRIVYQENRTEPERPSPTVVTPTPEPTKSPDD